MEAAPKWVRRGGRRFGTRPAERPVGRSPRPRPLFPPISVCRADLRAVQEVDRFVAFGARRPTRRGRFRRLRRGQEEVEKDEGFRHRISDAPECGALGRVPASCSGIKHQPLLLQICAGYFDWKDLRIYRLSSAFRRLKRLELSRVHLDHSFTDTLYSGCPVLEDLVLDSCRNDFDGIQSNKLRNLSVCTCTSPGVDVLVVRAPCLASLCLRFHFFHYKNGISLEAGNSLVRASISVGFTFLRGQTILVGSLFNVTSLELDGFEAMAILDKELDKFPTFDNLRTLSVNRCFHSERDVDKFKAIGRFLQKSPNLEKLSLHNFWYFEGTVREPWMSDKPRLKKVKPVVGPIEFPMHGNLRTLFLDECDLRDNFWILRHFLRRCPNLEKLTVRLCKLPKACTGGAKLKTTGKKEKEKENTF